MACPATPTATYRKWVRSRRTGAEASGAGRVTGWDTGTSGLVRLAVRSTLGVAVTPVTLLVVEFTEGLDAGETIQA